MNQIHEQVTPPAQGRIDQARFNVALAERLGLDPHQLTSVSVKWEAGERRATVQWTGVARIPTQEVLDALEAAREDAQA